MEIGRRFPFYATPRWIFNKNFLSIIFFISPINMGSFQSDNFAYTKRKACKIQANWESSSLVSINYFVLKALAALRSSKLYGQPYLAPYSNPCMINGGTILFVPSLFSSRYLSITKGPQGINSLRPSSAWSSIRCNNCTYYLQPARSVPPATSIPSSSSVIILPLRFEMPAPGLQ